MDSLKILKSLIFFSLIIVILLITTNHLQNQNYETDPTKINPITNEPEYSTVREFEIDAYNFAYSKKLLSINYGEKIRIKLTSTHGTHDFKIDKLNITSNIVSEGESTYIEFIPTQKGEFIYYCSLGDHRTKGMEGKLFIT